MDRFKSDNLVVWTNGDNLVVDIRGNDAARAEVSMDAIPGLMDFLQYHQGVHSNRRRGYRLNLEDLEPDQLEALRVSLEPEPGQWLAVKAVNLSRSGIHIESEQYGGGYGDQVLVRVQYGTESVDLPAVLVRQTSANHTAAFHFTDVYDDEGALIPPVGLVNILAELEEAWLDQAVEAVS